MYSICTYVEVIAEAAVDSGAEVDEAIVGRDDAFDHLPVHVSEHDVLVGQAGTQPVLGAGRRQTVEVQQFNGDAIRRSCGSRPRRVTRLEFS